MTDDEKIAALFAAPEREADEAFVARVERAVHAEQRLAAARGRAWRRFAIECAASFAIVTAFGIAWRLGATEVPLTELPVAPAAAAAVLFLGLWFGVELRPVATGR
jgi:hypothetical protein